MRSDASKHVNGTPRSCRALAAAMPDEPAPMIAAVGRVAIGGRLTEDDACVKFVRRGARAARAAIVVRAALPALRRQGDEGKGSVGTRSRAVCHTPRVFRNTSVGGPELRRFPGESDAKPATFSDRGRRPVRGQRPPARARPHTPFPQCLAALSDKRRADAQHNYAPNCITWWMPVGLFVYCIAIRGTGAKVICSLASGARQAVGSAPCRAASFAPAASSAAHSSRAQVETLPLPQ